MASHHESNHSAAHAFLRQVNLGELCNIASSQRQGLSCTPGNHTIGGFNIIQELVFEDDITWLARIPRPDASFQPEEATLSYAAVLRYLKMHSTIPVPTVFDYATSSNQANTLGISYILMEKLPGIPLPTFEEGQNGLLNFDPSPAQLQLAHKVHQQLTDVIIELARHQFPQIGALRETPSGAFTVVEYFDPYFTGYPEERAVAFSRCDRGPYKSISEFYSCISKLNILQTINSPPDEYTPGILADYEALAEIGSKFVIPEFDNGPFVIGHTDLTFQNILVDDEFNITGIIDFPGTVVPLPSLCILPWLFYENIAGPITKRQPYRDVFTSRVSDCQSSALSPPSMRCWLMETAGDRAKYEQALLGPYAGLVLPGLYRRVYGKEYHRTGKEPEK